MALSIGFIMPPSRANYKPFRNQPLVLLYLLTILERRFGDAVDLSLIDLRGIEEDNIVHHVPEKDAYLYSVATPDFVEVTNIVRELKVLYPKAKHIAGGAHVTLFPKETSQIFDAVVTGEGEESIYRVITDLSRNSLESIYPQRYTVNLDDYPIPSRHWLPRKAVVDTGLLEGENSNLPATTVLFSRGCPFSCVFCANKRLTFGEVRFRSPTLVTEEIDYLKRDYGVKALALKDDSSIPINVKTARPFLEAIGRAGVRWRGQSRASGVHPDMVQLAKESGCTDIAIGLESVIPEVLRAINKTIDIEKAKEYVRLLNKTGIGVRLHLIIGLPGEPDDIVERTLQFINEVGPKSVLLSYLCPLPGSELFDNPDKFNIEITTHDWSKYTLTAGRFDKDEKPSFVFKYRAGFGTPTEQICYNYLTLQSVLRERGLNF